jgi:hypothetical protein
MIYEQSCSLKSELFAIYEGLVLRGKAEYEGRILFSNLNYYKGSFEEGMFNG